MEEVLAVALLLLYRTHWSPQGIEPTPANWQTQNSATVLQQRTKYSVTAKHKDSPVRYRSHQTANHWAVV